MDAASNTQKKAVRQRAARVEFVVIPMIVKFRFVQDTDKELRHQFAYYTH
jgi:hypothetical protein